MGSGSGHRGESGAHVPIVRIRWPVRDHRPCRDHRQGEGGLFLPAIKRTVAAEANGTETVDPLMKWSAVFDVALFGFVVWALVVKLGT